MTKQYEQEIEKAKQKLQEWRDNNINVIAESTQRPYTEILQDIAAWCDTVENGTYKNENT
jgi:predicted nucleotide-binding protein (sugar kinase/HSP70/actin superfamily)